ncbi:MAG: C69 family dipeptidase [Lachnospiraceae bacterium]|nr:C69 family dipeptidase [Lachnospiraceae bacterium]
MACTTLLVGKNASWDGSTMIARNDDSGSGKFTPKKFTVVEPEDQPREYESVISHVKITLPDNPQRYTAMPNALKGEGIWAACGINESGVAMTATETITSNPRVLGADPLVEYQKKWESQNLYFGTDSVVEEEGTDEEKAGGIGEEDLVVITLPYVETAREGVKRLGELHEKYGTYEENGIGISDKDEIWWFESVGGHHWIARKVDDDGVVVMPNQLGIDGLDIDDALGEQESNMCSADLREFIEKNHLDLENHDDDFDDDDDEEYDDEDDHYIINPRIVFGSHDDADHVYNTPRAWYMLRYLDDKENYEGPEALYGPEDDDLPWQVFPDNKITPEDVKYLLSSHYQGTKYDPYLSYGDKSSAGAYRSIGINRNDFLGFAELRPDAEPIEWVAFGSNAFNVMAPFYTNVSQIPEYLSNTTGRVSTDNFYWTSRLIAALSDATYGKCQNVIEIYNDAVMSKSHALLNKFDAQLAEADDSDKQAICEEANEEIADMLKKEADKALSKALFFRSNDMKNQYARSDH